MASTSLPFTLTAGAAENVNQLNSNLTALLDAVNSVDTTQLDATTVLTPLGLTGGGSTRRGKCIIATSQSRTSTSYGTHTTPDQVSNVVLPSDGLIHILYHALWQESVAAAASAAIFIGSNQLKLDAVSAPAVQAAATATGTAAVDVPLVTVPGGLACATGQSSSWGAPVTTGQPVAVTTSTGGVCSVFAAAGTYTVSIQTKSTSGSVTLKNRSLWVCTQSF